ncbi:MAG TPA: terminase large subunit [Sideroxyarcus sp.]|nr:terminase large subunit [Sideroxyarcus sp.]
MTASLPKADPVWAPAWSVPSLSDTTRGPDVSDFAALTMRASRGFKVGEPLEFTAWQSWLIDRLLETDPATGLLRFRRAVILLPRKNGKSLLGTALALEHLMYGPQGAQVYSAAADRQQAKIVFGEARQQVLNNPVLAKHVKVYRDALEVPAKGSVYRALSADAARAHGLGPSLVVADELHAWPSSASNHRGDELWDALTTGSADRPESLVVAITTAGGNTDTLLGRLYEHGKRVAAGEIDDPQFGFWSWEASQEDDPTDPEIWRRANPNLAEGLLDLGDFEAAIAAAGSAGFAGFQRFRLNQWVRLAGEDFMSPHFWAAVKRDETIPAGATVVAGFDGSFSGDATGIVIQDVETGTLAVHAVWEPDLNDPEWTVDRADVNAAIERLFETYDVRMLWCDPSFYEPDVAEWAKRWRRRVERIPPTNNRVAPMAQQFLADIIAGEIGHDGDPRLQRHVLNAVATEAGSFKKEKRMSPRKVDLLACAVLANGARQAVKDRPKKKQRATIL